ncbi:MAG: 3-deoxy-D-manno-octulosonic acid transferase [Prevotellaceae bacterium]|nr:3-deoxy-D-manno-octulosonic acid transferase [Prevotellaceae bacterium]
MIYNNIIFLYRWAIIVGALFNGKISRLRKGQKEAISILKKNIDPESRYIWIHAASLGEFEQGRPLIEKLKAERPHCKILLTFFSPSGYEVRKNYEKADVICYLPMDTPRNAYRFVKYANLEMAIFIKYEFWGNYLKFAHRKKIPVYLISAIFRPRQLFFKWYGGFYRGLLKYFDHLFVQDENSVGLLHSIGVTNVTVAGDTRFDRVIEIASQVWELPITEAFAKGHLTMVAGSSWAKDEDIFIRHFNKTPGLKLIIAPHVVSQEHIFEICSKLKRRFVRLSEATEENAQNADCLIIDSIGYLSSVYRYGQIAYIGGGFGAGIHNTLEAAVFGMPVLFGTNYERFHEAVELVKAGAAFPIADYEEYCKQMKILMNNKDFLKKTGEIAYQYVHQNSGATEKILSAID